MLDGIQPRALGEHPAGEDALNFPVQLDLIDLDKRGCVRRLSRRSGVAGARGDFKRAELDGLSDRNFEMRDAARDLIEGREHGDRVLDLVGQCLSDTQV